MDDSKLSQESNLTVSSHTGCHITLYISFNKRRCLASEGLVNLTGDTGPELRSASTRCQDVIRYLRTLSRGTYRGAFQKCQFSLLC